MTSSIAQAGAPPSEATLRPTGLGRRAAAWLVDLVIVAALVGVVYLTGLIRIQGCDTFDPDTGTFGRSCPFEQTREVEREDGTIEVVYVLGSGRELPVDHPTVKTVLLGTRVVDPPGSATYLVGLGYVLVVFVLLQGLTGRTPGKLVTGIRLVREDGSAPGLTAGVLRWLVVDGAIGLFGVLMGLVDGPWPLRLLAVDAAVGLLGGLAALNSAQGRPGDQLAHTLVVDDSEAARARHEAQARSEAASDASSKAPASGGATTEGAEEPATPEPATVGSSAAAVPSAATATATASGAAGGMDAEGTPSESAGAIALGPVPHADGGDGDDQHSGGDAGRGDPQASPEPTTTSSPIPAPPARPSPTGARPLWGSTTSGVPGRRDPGRFPAPEYETTPPLWDAPRPESSDPATEGRSDAGGEEAAEQARPDDEARPDEGEERSGAVAATSAETSPDLVPDDVADEAAPADRADEAATLEEPVEARTDVDEQVDESSDTSETVIPAGGPEWGVEDRADESTAPASTTEEPGDTDTGAAAAGEGEGEGEGGTEAAAGGSQQQPLWDEARRAYIFWDRRRQEWLEFDYENQRWGPISR